MEKSHWLLITASFLSLVYCQVVYGCPSQARVKKSAVDTLQDYGIYIVHFKSNTKETEQQHFVAVLNRKLNTTVDFVVEIIENFFAIKCLTAKLSKTALQWVRYT